MSTRNFFCTSPNFWCEVDQIIEVEFGANIALDAELIKPNGRIAAYGSAKVMEPTLPFLPLLFKAVTIDIILVYLLTEAGLECAPTGEQIPLREFDDPETLRIQSQLFTRLRQR